MLCPFHPHFCLLSKRMRSIILCSVILSSLKLLLLPSPIPCYDMLRHVINNDKYLRGGNAGAGLVLGTCAFCRVDLPFGGLASVSEISVACGSLFLRAQ